MLSVKLLKTSQQDAIDRLYDHDATILIAPTGAGKTIICLTAIKELIDAGELTRVIVACPAKVVDVWPREVEKWEHLKGLGVVTLTGGAVTRSKNLHATFLSQPYEVVVVSLNNLDWLLKQKHGADGIIVDELTKAAGKQARGLGTKKLGACFKWRVGMTATPVSQDFEKMQGMCKIIDGGAALGRNKQTYLEKYFFSDYAGYNWTLRDDSAALIMGRVKSLLHVIEDTKAQDLPPLSANHIVRFDMPPDTREIYNQMKKDMVAGDVEAANEAVKSGKLRQIASGFVYNNEEGTTKNFDAARYHAAKKWIDALDPATYAGRGIIFYEYEAQRKTLLDIPHRNVHEDVQQFIRGESNVEGAEILIAQINSLSHGVDGLQDVCADALFYHPMWSRDATEQAIGRLWRTGQKSAVNITTLVCNDTLDDLVLARVDDRGEFMKMFMQHVKS